MLFNSYEFIFLFLPVTLAGFYILARSGDTRRTNAWLTLASLVFYGYWDMRCLSLLVASACVNFFVGERLARSRKKSWLFLGVVFNLALLGYFKYTGFFIETLNDIAGHTVAEIPGIILPIGISFFTFTQTAYLVDVFRGGESDGSFLTYLEFVTIFPHLVAGPILSHREIAPQLRDRENLRVNWENISAGICLFILGLFKKTVIADNLAPWANFVFANASAVSPAEAWIGIMSYMFQLYFDFSGYSEMAVGLGLMINLKLPVNFDSPYQAKNVIDFWRRWHMTLGIWVKEYLYIPLGGSRRGETRRMANLFFCMIVIGFWHGAGWTYICWGLLQGVYLLMNHQWRRLGLSMPVALSWPLTFAAEVFSQTFFRAESVADGVALVRAMTSLRRIVLPEGGWLASHGFFLERIGIAFGEWHAGLPFKEPVITLFVIAIILAAVPNPIRLAKRLRPSNVLAFALALLFVISLLSMTRPTEFLYFQF